MVTSRPRIPLADENDPVERAAREQSARRAVRAQRVESRELPACRICGGATGEVDDETLACDCDEREADVRARAARIARIAHEHRDRDGDRSDRIAP